MNKQDMMKQFSAEVARYMAEGWLLVPNNISISNGLIHVKLEREGERHTLRIMEKMELSHDIYIVERVDDITGETLEQENFYYLWDWRRQDEDNHKIVTVEEID